MNSEGVSAMLNCGTMGHGPVATNITAIEWIIRDIISSTRARDATPTLVMQEINKYRGSEGGASAAGSVIVFARSNRENFEGGKQNPPGFIAEVNHSYVMNALHPFNFQENRTYLS